MNEYYNSKPGGSFVQPLSEVSSSQLGDHGVVYLLYSQLKQPYLVHLLENFFVPLSQVIWVRELLGWLKVLPWWFQNVSGRVCVMTWKQ